MTIDYKNDVCYFVEHLQKQKLDDGKINLLAERITPNMLYQAYFNLFNRSTQQFQRNFLTILTAFNIFVRQSDGNYIFSEIHYKEFLKKCKIEK